MKEASIASFIEHALYSPVQHPKAWNISLDLAWDYENWN